MRVHISDLSALNVVQDAAHATDETHDVVIVAAGEHILVEGVAGEEEGGLDSG